MGRKEFYGFEGRGKRKNSITDVPVELGGCQFGG